MSDHLAELRATLAREMPVTQHLGVEVVGRLGEALTLSAPLAANRNHQGTAFGGSLNAIATLACWSALWLALRDAEQPGVVLIQDSAIRYLRPVTTDFTATAELRARPDRETARDGTAPGPRADHRSGHGFGSDRARR